VQPTTNPPYIQQTPLTQGGTLANFFAGAQEEFQTMLRYAMYCSHQLKTAVGIVVAMMLTCFENCIGLSNSFACLQNQYDTKKAAGVAVILCSKSNATPHSVHCFLTSIRRL